MSTSGLFKSKQFKSKKNLKGLLISPPVLANCTSSLVSSGSNGSSNLAVNPHSSNINNRVIILRALYDFQAESEIELTVKSGEYLRLIDKPGNGWLCVQNVDRCTNKGLVPAAYVDIEVNDSWEPVTVDWLQEQEKEEILQQPQEDQSNCTSDDDEPKTPLEFNQKNSSSSTSTSNIFFNSSPKREQNSNTFGNFGSFGIPNLPITPKKNKSAHSRKSYSISTLGKNFIQSLSPVRVASQPTTLQSHKPPFPFPETESGTYSSSQNYTYSQPTTSGLPARLLNASTLMTPDDDFNFFQKESMMTNLLLASPTTTSHGKTTAAGASDSNKLQHISINNVLQYDNRFYYRVDITHQNKLKRYIMKTYQDFYNLHINLLILNIDENLPKLPQPIRQQTKQSLLIRCNELNVYINKLIKNEFFKSCDEMVEWLRSPEDQSPQLEFTSDDAEINQLLLPNSIDMMKAAAEAAAAMTASSRKNSSVTVNSMANGNVGKYSTTAPLPMASSTVLPGPNTQTPAFDYKYSNNKYSSYMHQRDKENVKQQKLKKFPSSVSSNTLNSYSSLIDRYEIDDESEDKKRNNSSGGSEEDDDVDSLFSELKKVVEEPEKVESPSTPIMESRSSFDDNGLSGSPVTPSTPPLAAGIKVLATHTPPPVEEEEEEEEIQHYRPIAASGFVKVKVLLNNQEDDIIVLKVQKKDIGCIGDLKRQVSEKIYKDGNLVNHYRLECDGKWDDQELLGKLRNSNKVNLMLIRVRN